MMKHYKTTPSLKQQENNRSHDLQEVRPNLNNISTSSSDSSLILEDRNDDVLQDYPHDQVARQVWDRYTSSSDVRNTSSISTCLEESAKPRSVPTNTRLNVSTLTRVDSKDPPASPAAGDTDDKKKPVEEVKKQEETTVNKDKIKRPATGSMGVSSSEKKVSKKSGRMFGMSGSELRMAGLVAGFCLILYIVLLILTVQAASCSDSVEEYLKMKCKVNN